MGSQRFTKRDRLLSGGQFQRVYQRRCRVSDSQLVVHLCENELGDSRLGLSVSRHVGNAVVRNQWKRRIREAFRIQRAELPRGVDLVVSPRGGAEPPDTAAICRALVHLARRGARRLSPPGSELVS